MKKKKPFAFVIGFDNYIEEREKFFKEHPDCTVIEEIKTLSYNFVQEDFRQRLKGIEIPKMQPQVIVMLTWGIIIEESEVIL